MEKKKKKTAGKSERVYVRLTKEEKKMMVDKAKKYQTLSSLVIDAVQNFDERQGKNRLNVLIDFSHSVTNLQSDITKIGNNINQIAHVLNRANKGITDVQLPKSDEIIEELFELRKILALIMKNINILSSKNSKV